MKPQQTPGPRAKRTGPSPWQLEERREFWTTIMRRGLGIPMMLFSYPWLGLLSPSLIIISPFLALLGCVLIAPDIAGYFSRIAGRLLWSGKAGDIRPMYGIPESRAARGKYVEAEQEYEKIIQAFPNEIKPHVDMINIAVVRLNNAELAEQLYQRGMTLLQDPIAKETLTQIYDTIRTRIKINLGVGRTTIPLDKISAIREQLESNRNKPDSEHHKGQPFR